MMERESEEVGRREREREGEAGGKERNEKRGAKKTNRESEQGVMWGGQLDA